MTRPEPFGRWASDGLSGKRAARPATTRRRTGLLPCICKAPLARCAALADGAQLGQVPSGILTRSCRRVQRLARAGLNEPSNQVARSGGGLGIAFIDPTSNSSVSEAFRMMPSCLGGLFRPRGAYHCSSMWHQQLYACKCARYAQVALVLTTCFSCSGRLVELQTPFCSLITARAQLQESQLLAMRVQPSSLRCGGLQFGRSAFCRVNHGQPHHRIISCKVIACLL
jgi:hypothetical protein